ncbi:MAG: OmpA family protein [Bacteroidetes bacterium]|nr:OmpA family protein [Bacteroidota bacterium]
MSKFLQAFVVFLSWSLFAILFHFYISDSLFGNCSFNHQIKSNKTEIQPNNFAENNPELLKVTNDKGISLFEINGSFKIKKNSIDVVIDSSLNSLKDSVTLYLKNNPSHSLIIVSNYLNDEVNTTTGVNLGQQRGDFIKNWLMNSEVAEDRILIETQLTDYKFDEKGYFNQAISLYFKDLVALKASVATDVVTKKTLRFSFGNQSFRPTPELIEYVIELKSYLGQYPNKKIYVTGHTDSEGDVTYNYNIGLQRAQFVKDFLISQEIEAYKIVSSSKGELEPVADNSTKEGKSLNRRIEIIIK